MMPQIHQRPRSASPARPTSSTPQAQGRWYCPVTSCPDHCQESSRGWTSFEGLRFHLDLHFMGELSGQVPLGWLQHQGYGVWTVCNCVLSSHFNGLHPRCYRAFTAAVAPAPPTVRRPLLDGALVCPMFPLPTAGSGHRSLRAPETCGASASSTHSRQWLHIGTKDRGSTSSPCLL